MIGAGLFNAMAFAGAGVLLKKLDKHGYESDSKRPNLAMEKLAKAREEWNRKEAEEKKKYVLRRQELTEANADINETNKALENYKKAIEIVYEGRKFTREPHIWDFYTPSEEMKDYMTLAIGTMGLVGGWMGGKIILRLL